MRSFLSIAACALPLSLPVLAISPLSEILVTQEIMPESIYPHELVYISCVISNTTDRPIVKSGSNWVTCRYRMEGGQWKTFNLYGPQGTPPAPKDIVLPANGILEGSMLMSADIDGTSCFSQPGVWEIQTGTIFGESEVGKLVVKPPIQASDALADVPRSAALLFDEYTFKWANLHEKSVSGQNIDLNSFGFMKRLASSDEYADWVQMARVWEAKYCGGQRTKDDNDPVYRLCQELVEKYQNRSIPSEQNPIPLYRAMREIAVWYSDNGEFKKAGEALLAIREKFANNKPILRSIDWEERFIPHQSIE